MTKSKVSLILTLVLVVAGLIVAMLPGSVAAAPGIIETNFSEAVFEDFDAFYGGVAVVAYQAGSTLKMEFRVQNDLTSALTINGATATFDFGTFSPTTPTAYPFQLRAGQYASFRFECPIPADVSNQTLHNYRIAVQYEGATGPAVVNHVAWENAADLNLDYDTVVPDSVSLWDVTTTGALEIPKSNYSVALISGTITWTAPYVPTGTVYAVYDYIEDGVGPGGPTSAWLQGDGVKKTFVFESTPANLPIVADSVKVVLKATDGGMTSVTKIDTGWTVDLQNGTVTFDTAPKAYEQVGVFYKRYSSFVQTGANLAVYSADQAGAVAASQTYANMNAAYPAYMFTPGTAAAKARSDATVKAVEAADKYSKGSFAAAKTDYDAAVTSLQAAIDADNTLNSGIESSLTTLLANGSGVVDAYANKLDGEAKAAEGQASMYKNVGVFAILLGVATLLAGIGGILWAYSRLVEARGPKQQM